MQLQLTKKITPADLTVLALFSNQKPSAFFKDLPLDAESDFKNQLGATQLIYTPHGRILLAGLGDKKDFSPQAWRTGLHAAVLATEKLRIASLNLIMPKFAANQEEDFFELTGFSLTFSAYRFEAYKKEKKTPKLTQINLIAAKVSAKLNKAIQRGQIIGLAANNSRDIANHPANVATPAHLASQALELAKKHKFSCKILTLDEIKKEKLGLLDGVGKGSSEKPRFIILELGAKTKPPIILIGKGLTFDSGGVSIKPAERMEEMKYDMCGGADVLGIFEAAVKLELPHHLIGLIPAAENLPSGSSIKPGDILIAHDGTSVEIINTDAEGRMVLADAISFAKKYYKPRLIVDYATLTGAVVLALGDQVTGYFCNTPIYKNQIILSAKKTAEELWELPLVKEYKEQLKSTVADIKNIGGKPAGAITAALFLEHFVGTTPWIHFDTAGTAWTMRPKAHTTIGATAWGVYLTLDFLRRLKP